MSLLALNNVNKYFGAELVLDSVSFRIERGDRVALIGPNGAGKSTILRIITGLEEPDSGTVSRTRNMRVAYLPQEPDFRPTDTLHEAVLEAFREAIDAQDQLRGLEARLSAGESDQALLDEYGRLQALVEHAGYDYGQQTERVLTGLGLGEETWNTPVINLSGGQRTRANLARTLLQDADLLLLDEPTNHLDIAAVEWLESYLSDLKRTYLIVAHDRYLLDHVTRRTLELSRGRVSEYDAPYSRYLELRAERMERLALEYEAQQQHIAKTEDFIRRYGAGQRYKEARGRQKRLDRLERIERPQDNGTVKLRMGGPKRSGDIALEVRHLVAGYGERSLVTLPDEVVVRRGEHIAIIGPNGSGKTTLVRTLVGALPPLHGTIRWGANTSVGYYSQTLGQLDESLSVLEEIQRTKPLGEEEGRNFLGRFLFSADDVFKTVSILSGGERSRVALAKLILEDSNVLMLDEPTNHLDIASRDALQVVLSDFRGTLLFVSHDRYLIDSLVQHLWAIEEGRLVRYNGTYSDVAGGRATAVDVARPGRVPKPRPVGSPDDRLQQLQLEAETLATRLSETATTTSFSQLRELIDTFGDLQANVAETQEDWLRSVRGQLRTSLE